MNILAGYTGIVTAFIIIATLLLWLLIRSKISIFIKIIIVPLVIWYSLILYYTPGKLLGWPTTEDIPDHSAVINMLIREPKAGDEGAIYLWLIDTQSELKKHTWVNPKNIFSYNEKNVPRAYKIPYSRILHEKLQKGQEEKKRGMILILRNKKNGKKRPAKDGAGKNKQYFEEKEIDTEIVNPQTLLQKDGD